MKKLIIASIALIMGIYSFPAQAQDMVVPEDNLSMEAGAPEALTNRFLRRGTFSIQYSVSLPLGDFTDFISKPGTRGFNFELMGVINDNLTVGGAVGWYAFYEHFDRHTYEFENGALTSEIWNNYYSLPLRAIVQYYFLPDAGVQPFIGLNIAASYNQRETQVGSFTFNQLTWDFALTPELGVVIPFGDLSDWGALAKVRYNYTFYNHNNWSNIQYLDFSVGLIYSY